MPPKHRDGDVIAVIPGQWITHLHSISAYSAFLGALVVGVYLHYYQIVENQYYSYPTEWIPSVSSTIGDRFPERTVFQYFIAVCSGPRFLLCFLFYCLTNKKGEAGAKFVAGVGVLRTLTCGGWTYVTSTDNHDWHDIFMVSYLVASIPWTVGCTLLGPVNPRTVRLRKWLGGAFFATLVPMLYFFLQHKIHHVAGAYTIYAFFEWTLVLLDVGFDAVTAIDFAGLELVVKDIKGMSRGDNKQVQDAVLEKQKDMPIGQVFDHKFDVNELADAAADVYLGFVFWSVLTSLGVSIWYFPLWHMGLSGYEVVVMSTISPFLLEIPQLRRLAGKNVTTLQLSMGLFGLGCYALPSPLGRLGAVTVAVWQGCLAYAAVWWRDRGDAPKLEARISGFVVGLIGSSIAKFANGTNNPTWPIMNEANGGWNKTFLALFALAIVWLYMRQSTMASSGSMQKHEGPAKGSSVLPGLGFAGLLFALHSLLSDSSTIILWVWSGYPVKGPLAVPHGAWTILTMGFGLVFGLFYPNLTRSWTAFGVGSIGAAFLTLFEDWTGYYGGLALTFYLTAITPILVTNAVKFPPGRTFFTGFFVYNFMVLFHVWVVAYAFVPGGPLVREHTDWVMATTMLLIGCGVFSALQNSGGQQQRTAQNKSSTYTAPPPNPAARRQRSYYIAILLFLQLLSISIAYLRFPSYNYQPYHKDSRAITAGIWTTHFNIDNDMWSSDRRIKQLIQESELDLIGLLESDTQRIIMGMRDPTQYLAEELGMWVDFGPGPNKHTWGCALLSKFPILNSTHHLTPSPSGELAPAIHATILAYDTLVDVFVFHSGQEEDVEDRRQQTAYMSQLMGSHHRPAILLSYLITKPGEGNYNTWVSETSGMKDIDARDWDRWCEYILYRGLKRTGYARVSRGTITDTELQVGKFVVGEPDGSGELIPEDQVPLGLRFPSMFRGEGVRGHRYHVFDEPRYYA
ncbi:Protein cwh43 [Recurvomyces mirabilis]|nr:Protein cwh43 [Recurvomyces mirabilis]